VTVTKCGNKGGCTSIEDVDTNPLDCERVKQDPCTSRWKFDARVTLKLLVEYNVDPNLPSGDSPGLTLRGHEMLHVSDFFAGCRGLNSRIKTEGFTSPQACRAARLEFRRKVLEELQRVSDLSKRNRDASIR
jgi:hypothetical protein